MTVQIHTVFSKTFGQNSYILWREGAEEALVVDPGFDPEAILAFLTQRGFQLAAILNTHGHADHIAGNSAMKEAFPSAPLVIGTKDAPMLTDPELNLSRGYGFDLISPPADQLVQEEETLHYAGIELKVYDIPGHSPGHVVFHYLPGQWVMGGDVLFRGGVGRTDFPGGSFTQLAAGIREKLFTLDPQTVVYPGHGPVTKTGYEKRTNPFVGDSADPRLIG